MSVDRPSPTTRLPSVSLSDSLPALSAPVTVEQFQQALGVFSDVLTANFGSLTKAQPEDQLKAPVMVLLEAAGQIAGMQIVCRTEMRVEGIGGRPDIGVDTDRLPVGSVELKAHGKGARPERFKDKRSRNQFKVFSDLPNLVYTDGQDWGLYRYGKLQGDVLRLSFDPTSDGAVAVTGDDARGLLSLLGRFLKWEPTIPTAPRALAAMIAPVTRRLHDEVIADVQAKGPMASLYADWKDTLFPDADVQTFSDAYAQTFIYALLLARLEGAESPFTTDSDLFARVVALGRDLIWWGTYGERFGPDGATQLPSGTARNTVAVSPGKDDYPEKCSYNTDTKMVTVGDGQFGPVEPEVWTFQVSGLKVVQSWLGYRMKVRSGKKSSPLDDIRPDSWTFSGEFLELLWVIEHFVARTADAAILFGEVVDGDLIDPALFPVPTDAERKAPKVKKRTKQNDMFKENTP